MKTLIAALALAGFLVQSPAFASMNHPEEAYPDDLEPLASPDGPYKEFFQQIQAKLNLAGFNAGPVNGSFGAKTQAALAQFQLSRTIPASGQLDDQTLAELGVQRDEAQASAAAGR